jgi:hypothetical protein
MSGPTSADAGDVMLVKRSANEAMYEVYCRRVYDDRIAFFCECDDDRCYQVIWLTVDQYRRARTNPQWQALGDAHVSEDGNGGFAS